MYTVTYRKEAIKYLRKMPRRDANRFLAAFEKIAKKETKGLNIKQFGQLKNGYRLRIGNYRALYSIYESDLVIEVVKLGVRGDIYK